MRGAEQLAAAAPDPEAGTTVGISDQTGDFSERMPAQLPSYIERWGLRSYVVVRRAGVGADDPHRKFGDASGLRGLTMMRAPTVSWVERGIGRQRAQLHRWSTP
jgi:hypothetical protein